LVLHETRAPINLANKKTNTITILTSKQQEKEVQATCYIVSKSETLSVLPIVILV